MESASYSEILAAIRAGMGAGFLSHEITRTDEMLAPIVDSAISTKTSLWVLTHRDLINVRRIREFVGFVADELSRVLA